MNLKSVVSHDAPLRVVRHRMPAGILTQPVVATLGKFDGVHLGHQELLRKMAEYAPRSSRVAVLLYPHPARVLHGVNVAKAQSLKSRIRHLERHGVDIVFLVHFTAELAALSAEEFLDRFLIKELGARHLVVGEDAAVGKNRVGTTDFMVKFLGGKCEVHVVPFTTAQGRKLGTRQLTEALKQGDCDLMYAMLGRYHALEGRVVRGAQRGRLLGFPTANIMCGDVTLPPNGVYATVTMMNGCAYPGVTNIGVKPTFGSNETSVETFLFDYSGPEFYGARQEVSLVSHLREEKRFGGVDELVSQIRADISQARRVLAQKGL